MGDIVEGDAAMDDRRGGGGISSGSSMPRYPYKSASARVSARLADDVDKSDMLAIMKPKNFQSALGPSTRSERSEKAVLCLPEFGLSRSYGMMQFSDGGRRGMGGTGGTGGTGSQVGGGA